ncbi:7655_t:CDS:2 [Entrophospora sp. SA101]|nr:6387_t:CDS:2 [Entrophospora sp. SA101]CAJ0765080.1 7655_t:CDS:2 [Entrophospora sp. SA101]CAJ0847330.1 12368_t:CDS:2 [Entrophospora sp. SA101]
MSEMMAIDGSSINNTDYIDENNITENSLLSRNSFECIGYYGAEMTRSREYRDSKPERKIGCFSLQFYSIVTVLILNIVHGVAFGIILFPTNDRYKNRNEELFKSYKYIGMMMFFMR